MASGPRGSPHRGSRGPATSRRASARAASCRFWTITLTPAVPLVVEARQHRPPSPTGSLAVAVACGRDRSGLQPRAARPEHGRDLPVPIPAPSSARSGMDGGGGCRHHPSPGTLAERRGVRRDPGAPVCVAGIQRGVQRPQRSPRAPLWRSHVSVSAPASPDRAREVGRGSLGGIRWATGDFGHPQASGRPARVLPNHRHDVRPRVSAAANP